jgi:hypothetical protein
MCLVLATTRYMRLLKVSAATVIVRKPPDCTHIECADTSHRFSQWHFPKEAVAGSIIPPVVIQICLDKQQLHDLDGLLRNRQGRGVCDSEDCCSFGQAIVFLCTGFHQPKHPRVVVSEFAFDI